MSELMVSEAELGEPQQEFAGRENVTATTLMPRQVRLRVAWSF